MKALRQGPRRCRCARRGAVARPGVAGRIPTLQRKRLRSSARGADPKDQLIEHLNQNILAAGDVPAWRCDRVEGADDRHRRHPCRRRWHGQSPRCLRMRVANPLTGGDAARSREQRPAFLDVDEGRQPLAAGHDMSGTTKVDLLAQASVMPIPVHPHWLMEVLGVVPLESRPGIRSSNRPAASRMSISMAERTARTAEAECWPDHQGQSPAPGSSVEHRLQKAERRPAREGVSVAALPESAERRRDASLCDRRA